jgi:rhodanese-related sulfurtransferase
VKIRPVSFVLLALLGVLASCKPALPRISINDFERMLAEGKVAVVDVRSREEYAAGHIPGALSIPVEEIEARAAEVQAFRRPIVAYCSCLAEESSLTAVATLSRLGVRGARALTGGYPTWALGGRRVVGGPEPL